MAKNAATHLPTALAPAVQPASSPRSLAPVIGINVRYIGRKPQPQTLIGATAPEGWIKKIDRPREGKLWVGYFHLYVADSFGRPVRKKKEKTLGPATMPKHEAQQRLAEYIEEFTGKLIRQGDAIESFADLWKAFSAVKAGSWGKKMREDMKYLFDKHHIFTTPIIHEEFQGIRITPNVYTTFSELDRFCEQMELIARKGLPM